MRLLLSHPYPRGVRALWGVSSETMREGLRELPPCGIEERAVGTATHGRGESAMGDATHIRREQAVGTATHSRGEITARDAT